MGEPPAVAPPPEQAAKPASYARIVVMLLVGGPILAVGGCALFLSFLNLEGSSSGRDSLSAFGAITFIVGCLAFLLGLVWAFARWADRRFKKAGK